MHPTFCAHLIIYSKAICLYIITKKYLLKKIYDRVTEDIFDMSNVRIVKEMEKKKMVDVYKYILLCIRSAKSVNRLA